MFKFDDRYIIFVILSPGIFFIGLLYILFSLCSIPIHYFSFNNTLIDFGFGAIVSLLVGCILWYANHELEIVSKHRLKTILKGIEDETLLKPFRTSLSKLKEQFKADFKKDFIPEEGKTQFQELNTNFTDIFYGLDRTIGLKTPSAVKLLREFLEQIIVAIRLLMIPSLVIAVKSLIETNWSEISIISVVVFIILFLLNFLLIRTLIAKDRRFYVALLDVYTANHYKNIITKDLERK